MSLSSNFVCKNRLREAGVLSSRPHPLSLTLPPPRCPSHYRHFPPLPSPVAIVVCSLHTCHFCSVSSIFPRTRGLTKHELPVKSHRPGPGRRGSVLPADSICPARPNRAPSIQPRPAPQRAGENRWVVPGLLLI